MNGPKLRTLRFSANAQPKPPRSSLPIICDRKWRSLLEAVVIPTGIEPTLAELKIRFIWFNHRNHYVLKVYLEYAIRASQIPLTRYQRS